jgi:hypothetical protein
MVLKRQAVEERLKELDEILRELGKHRRATLKSLRANLSRRWVRGLIAAASMVFDIADHIL